MLQTDPAPRRLRFRQQSAPPMGFEPTIFPVTGERPFRTGPRGRLSCRGGTRTHGDRLIRAVPCRLATPQCCSPGCQRPIEPSTPCGSRTRPLRLERPPTSPEVQRGIRVSTKANRPGVASTPGRRDVRSWRKGLSAGIQTDHTHLHFSTQALRGDRGNAGDRQAKFIARMPECHGSISKFGVISWILGGGLLVPARRVR